MSKADMFWTDVGQARERIAYSVVNYDGIPVYIDAVFDEGETASNKAQASIRNCDKERQTKVVDLDDPKFKKYRDLPVLGWMNAYRDGGKAVLVARRPVRARQHGLSRANTYVFGFAPREGGNRDFFSSLQPFGDGSFDTYMYDNGFKEMNSGLYPSLVSILTAIEEKSAIAFSSHFCVMCDDVDIRWLLRGKERVGIFGGDNTLLLLKKFAYLREEIMDEPRFTIDQIREL